MSASIDLRPETASHSKVIPFPANARTHAVTSPRLAVVVAYANPDGRAETQVDEESDASLVDALRHQILSLAGHYARDVASLTEREEQLMADKASLEADNLDAWKNVASMHVRAASAEYDAATEAERADAAATEADEFFRQVRELSILLGELRADLTASEQRARLLEDAAECRFFEGKRKRQLLEAAARLPRPGARR